jgi:hypothetical protein
MDKRRIIAIVALIQSRSMLLISAICMTLTLIHPERAAAIFYSLLYSIGEVAA